MPSTLVLGIALVVRLLLPLVHVFAASVLARRNGLSMTKMGWSSDHGYSAEFEKDEPQSGSI